jgi:hypothetical protein
MHSKKVATKGAHTEGDPLQGVILLGLAGPGRLRILVPEVRLTTFSLLHTSFLYSMNMNPRYTSVLHSFS